MEPAPNVVSGSLLCLVALFLPGLLLVAGALPFWDALRSRPLAQAAMRGTNAAVVGILGAALYDPVWTSAILGPYDFALALLGFLLLAVWKAPPWVVVAVLAAGGRSEEHTSELQSLMRISYAVFSLNKKKKVKRLYS